MPHQKHEIFPLKKLLISLLICVGGGWLAGWLTESGVKDWYPHLIKPSGTPPNIVFPIVWTILYTLMAISLVLLWISNTFHKKTAYLFFGIQLFLNFIWSWLFFDLKQPGLALINIILLWFFILLNDSLFLEAYPLWQLFAYTLFIVGKLCHLLKSIYLGL